jgi:hypothetical protein
MIVYELKESVQRNGTERRKSGDRRHVKSRRRSRKTRSIEYRRQGNRSARESVGESIIDALGMQWGSPELLDEHRPTN